MVRTRSSVQSRSLAQDLRWVVARVAQLVEHFTRNEEVASSILASGSKNKNAEKAFLFPGAGRGSEKREFLRSGGIGTEGFRNRN
jgi:hypothetical protein